MWTGTFFEPAFYEAGAGGLSRLRLPTGACLEASSLLGADYAEQYARASPQHGVLDEGAWRSLATATERGVLLPPGVAGALMDLAEWNDSIGFGGTSTRCLVLCWRDERGESPVFAFDEQTGFAWKRGHSVTEFLGVELEYRRRHFATELESAGLTR